MSDTPTPPVPVQVPDTAPDVPPVSVSSTPEAPVVPDFDIDQIPLDVLRGKVGKDVADLRHRWKPWEERYGRLDPRMKDSVETLVDNLLAGDMDAVTGWLETSLTNVAGKDRIAELAARYGATSKPPVSTAPGAAQVAEQTGQLTAEEVMRLLDERDARAREEQDRLAVEAAGREITEEVLRCGIDPDSPNGLAVWKKAQQMAEQTGRFVPIAQVVEAWRAETAAFLGAPLPTTGETQQPGVIAPQGAPGQVSQAATPRERMLERLRRQQNPTGIP